MRTSILQKLGSILRQRNSLDRQIERLTGTGLDPQETAEWLASEIFGLAFSDHVACWPSGQTTRTAWVADEGEAIARLTPECQTHWLIFSVRHLGSPQPVQDSPARWEIEAVYLIPPQASPRPEWGSYQVFPPRPGAVPSLSQEQAEALRRFSRNHTPALERTV